LIVTPRPIRQRTPITLFSITVPSPMMQPSDRRLRRIVAPSSLDDGRNRGRV
jgi:hypothetical protein